MGSVVKKRRKRMGNLPTDPAANVQQSNAVFDHLTTAMSLGIKRSCGEDSMRPGDADRVGT